jgi:hypothetical protein
MLIDQKRPPTPFPKLPEGLKIMGLFLLLAPLVTFLLIWLKGLPDFAIDRPWDVLLWVYSVTWIPAIMTGGLLSGTVIQTASQTRYFHQPYDFGRCFSLGAIAGALCEALSTTIYRTVSHRLFSDFWIAGAMIAGCITGGVVVAATLWQLSRKQA